MEETTVYRTWDEPMANMALGLLEGMGVHARAVADMTRSVYPFTMDGLGEIRIVVPEDEAEKAIELLSVRFSEDGIVEDDSEDDSGWDGEREPDEEDEKE